MKPAAERSTREVDERCSKAKVCSGVQDRGVGGISLPAMLPDLPAAIRSYVAQIPRGMVSTYGDLAHALGSRSAARWIGEYLVDHPHDANCHCHRVVRANGELGLFISRSTAEKRAALERESVIVRQGKVDLKAVCFSGFISDQPLAKLIEWQCQMASRATLQVFRGTPKTYGGVDVSYRQSGDAVAAFCLFDVCTGKCIWTKLHSQTVSFPYIPGFLAFRELPVLIEVLRMVREQNREPDVLFVDGSGILHPRRAGIATCLGVLTGLRTIGVSKRLLCGTLIENYDNSIDDHPIMHREIVAGMALRATGRSRQVHVSPGHRIDVVDAARMVRSAFAGHRLPEPLFLADKLSRAEARREYNR